MTSKQRVANVGDLSPAETVVLARLREMAKGGGSVTKFVTSCQRALKEAAIAGKPSAELTLLSLETKGRITLARSKANSNVVAWSEPAELLESAAEPISEPVPPTTKAIKPQRVAPVRRVKATPPTTSAATKHPELPDAPRPWAEELAEALEHGSLALRALLDHACLRAYWAEGERIHAAAREQQKKALEFAIRLRKPATLPTSVRDEMVAIVLEMTAMNQRLMAAFSPKALTAALNQAEALHTQPKG